MSKLYFKFGAMASSKPARSCVAVKEVPKGVLCEIEILAVLPENKSA